MSLRAQFIHSEYIKLSDAVIGEYMLGMIFAFFYLKQMTRLSFHGHKILIIHEQDRMMR